MERDSMSKFGEWEYICDRQATEEAYTRAVGGGSTACSCNGCRNFVAARHTAFPATFIELLKSWGIDSRKDGEVYHNARLASGLHDYGGWFHFIGKLEKTGDFQAVELRPGFTAWLLKASAPPLDVLHGLPLVEVQFHTDRVPWVLDESPAD
jgi:hypothetical protein